MTALTRAQEKGTEDKEQKAALDHVLHIVLGLPDTDPLVKAIKLDGCEHIQHFIRIRVENIACLQYINDDGLKMTIPTWYQEYMKIFKEYCHYKHQTATHLYNNWLYLTKNNFDLWTKQNVPYFKRPRPPISKYPSSYSQFNLTRNTIPMSNLLPKHGLLVLSPSDDQHGCLPTYFTLKFSTTRVNAMGWVTCLKRQGV